ncbi:helix-turn-helix domain-containing protein [Priestia megaterium]|nr:helix-turn-helix domain-containing protein [Priestia megaterium]
MCRLMIVDAEPLERQALRLILKRKFLNLTILEDAKNGVEAIKLANRFKPDIILMDIQLPGKNGFSVQREIMKVLPNVKIIIITAAEDFNCVQTALKHDVLDYLLKPARTLDIELAVDKAIKSINQVSLLDSISSKPARSSKQAINSILDYIHKNYNQPLTLNEIAQHSHLNPQYLSRYFKETVGMTFTMYLTNLRIENAKKLLINSDKSITQIALEVGYPDPSYFSKVFDKHVKYSPYKFKKRYYNIN